MLCRKCISAGSIREAEPLFMMWGMGFIIGIWTYTIVGFGKKSFKGFCLCRFWWAWNICRSVGPIAGKKKWREAGEKDKLESTSVSYILHPWWQWTSGNAGTLCYVAVHAPGSGLGEAEGGDLVEPEELQSWLWTLPTRWGSRNLMHISLVANPNPEPYRKGNLGKWNSSLVRLTKYQTTTRYFWRVLWLESSMKHASTLPNYLLLLRMPFLPYWIPTNCRNETDCPWLHGTYK